MILFSILSLLLSNAGILHRDVLILFNRIAILLLLFCILIDNSSSAIVTKGIGLFGGLLLITEILISFIHKAYYSSTPIKSATAFVHMQNTKRAYSTKVNKGDFWSKVNSQNTCDQENPFILVNSFLKNNPTQELARPNINLDLICSILSRHIPNFKLSLEVFNLLKEISPVRLQLPLQKTNVLVECLGNYVVNQTDGSELTHGKAGVYMFTNKLNGFSYVGSSISLLNRLTTGYLGPTLGNRVVDLAIKDVGLENFYLDLYIIPQELLDLSLTEVQSKGNNIKKFQEITAVKNELKMLSLALEQMFILEFNPEYNVLKVAGSPAGLKRSAESMLPSLIKNSKATYVYDSKTKKLIFIANSRSDLAKGIDVDLRNLSRILKEDKLYLDRFIVCSELLNESDYAEEILSLKQLTKFVDQERINWKKALSEKMRKLRLASQDKICKKVELTNINTSEVLVFNSLTETTKYIQSQGANFSKAQSGTLSINIKKGYLYKGVYKLKYIDSASS